MVPTPPPCSSHPWFYRIQHHSWAHSIPPTVEHLLNRPSNSALGFGLTLSLLMPGKGLSTVKQESKNRS